MIRRLEAADAQSYWHTRNRGLAEFPDAFTSSVEEGIATEPAELAKRFGANGSCDFVLGAFVDDGPLAGYAGFQRETRQKNRHKGTIVGMYVVPEFRGRGIGQELLRTLVAEVRALEGVEKLNLSVTHSNADARRLYLAAGFVSFGVEQNAIKVGAVEYAKEYMSLTL
ncbi:MAG: GNAT family N-acetyltransferase [Betaproteobacteria bacterium]